MAKSTLNNLITRTKDAELLGLSREYFAGVEAEQLPEKINEFNETVDILTSLMTSHISRKPQSYGLVNAQGKALMNTRERGEVPLLNFKEALMSNDASMLFKRVISDILLQPIETPYIGQDILARKITVDGVRQVTFPRMGGIRASEITEIGEYPQQSISLTADSLELRVRKYGLALAIGDDIIEDSMWDIFGLYVSMARDAMKRKKEELIFADALLRAHRIFDNNQTDTSGYTTGMGADGITPNGSLSMLDLLDTAGALIVNGYNPDYMVLHPLAWVMFAKDPRLLFHSLMGGAYGQTMPTAGFDAGSISKYLPFGALNVVTTPQMTLTQHKQITMNSVLMPACNVADILVLDKQQSLIVLQRDEMHMEEFDDPYRDIHMMRVGERYAVGTLDGGRSITSIKNVRLVPNEAEVFRVGTISPS